MRPLVRGAELLAAVHEDVAELDAPLAARRDAARVLPGYTGQRLAEAGLLGGVPLAHLVPHPDLLPPESMRFFTVDPVWVTALQRGVVSLADPDAGTGPATLDPPGPNADSLVGFVLASVVVSRHPGLVVRAFTGDIDPTADPDDPASGATPVDLLRLERLTPSLLVALFARPPDLLVVAEPHGTLRLGVTTAAGAPTVALRDAAGRVVTSDDGPIAIASPMRGDPGDGVLDVLALAAALDDALDAAALGERRPPDPSASSSALALALLQAPGEQRYTTREPG